MRCSFYRYRYPLNVRKDAMPTRRKRLKNLFPSTFLRQFPSIPIASLQVAPLAQTAALLAKKRMTEVIFRMNIASV